LKYTLPIKLEGSPVRQAGFLLGATAFVVGGAWLTGHENPKAIIAGWAGVIFFGLCAVFIAKQMATGGPRIVIDQNGIFDRTNGLGTIEWRDVISVWVAELQGQKFLCLELKHAEEHLARLSSFRRKLATVNRELGFTEFVLNITGTGADAEGLAEAITKELERRGISRSRPNAERSV
jgi:hypothetical protein